jgi:hypothetical protein
MVRKASLPSGFAAFPTATFASLSRDVLLQSLVDVVIVPPQWRAADILTEMKRAGIAVELVLIEHQGRLVDFRSSGHPYR